MTQARFRRAGRAMSARAASCCAPGASECGPFVKRPLGRAYALTSGPTRSLADLDDVRVAYEIARYQTNERAADAPHACRYCGRYWECFAGSKLDGHAKCIVTQSFKRRLHAFLAANPAITFRGVAAHLGVTESVVRAWIAPKSLRGVPNDG